jgi:hypothetical protein
MRFLSFARALMKSPKERTSSRRRPLLLRGRSGD